MSFLERHPSTLAETAQSIEEIYLDSEQALRGTRPDGPGQQAVAALAFAVEHIRYADNLVRQTGEGGI